MLSKYVLIILSLLVKTNAKYITQEKHKTMCRPISTKKQLIFCSQRLQ